MPFAVIDFETTGLIPERTDRVVEVGIVLADDDWQIEDEWTTLVNPRRDLGPVHIHGINAGDLLDAPEFADIGDHILHLLRGRTVVAHNASFDMRFLHAELLRANYAMPDRPEALCSMKWAGRTIGAAKLAHCLRSLRHSPSRRTRRTVRRSRHRTVDAAHHGHVRQGLRMVR